MLFEIIIANRPKQLPNGTTVMQCAKKYKIEIQGCIMQYEPTIDKIVAPYVSPQRKDKTVMDFELALNGKDGIWVCRTAPNGSARLLGTKDGLPTKENSKSVVFAVDQSVEWHLVPASENANDNKFYL